MKHIKTRLPSVHTQITELLRRKEKELQGYGESFASTVEEQQMFLYRIIEHYLEEYRARLMDTSDDLRAKGLDGGQQLMDILVNDFQKKLDAIPTALGMDRTLARQMIEANSGLQRSLFFPEATFHRLIVEAAENVHHTMLELHQTVHLNEPERFPRAKYLLAQSVTEIARESVEECLVFVRISILITAPVAILIVRISIISIISIVINVPVTILIVRTSIIPIVTNLRAPDRSVDRFHFNSADPRLGPRRRRSALAVITRRRFPPS
jgi:hypothetical protein